MIDPTEARPPRFRELAAIGCALAVLAFLCATIVPTAQGVPLVWPVAAIAVIYLASRAPKVQIVLLPILLIALTLAAVAAGAPFTEAAGLSAIDIVEIALMTRVVRQLGLDPSQPADLALVIGAGAVTVALSAAVAATFVGALRDVPLGSIASLRASVHALGLLIGLPVAAGFVGRRPARLGNPQQMGRLLLVAALTASTTAMLFRVTTAPMLFLLAPCVVLAPFLLEFGGATVAVGIIATIGGALSIEGHGPIAAAFPGMVGRLLFLQLFIAIMVLMAFPVAATLARTRRLIARNAASEDRFRRIAGAAPAAIARVGPDGAILYGNHEFERLTGHVDPVADGLAFSDLIPADAASIATIEWREDHGRLSAGGIDLRIVRRDGTHRSVNLAASPEHDSDGHVTGWVAMMLDLEQRHLAMAALAESESQLRLLAENSNDMIVRIGLDGTRRYVSPACLTLLGHTPEEMLGRTPIAEIHPTDRARVERVCRSLLDGVIDPICSYRQRHRLGHYVWLEATYRLVRDPTSGAPLEFIASVRDIAMRLEAERAALNAAAQLEENNRLLQMAEATAHVGHWRLDTATQSVFWSPEVYRIHGLSSDHVPTLENALSAYHADDVDRIAGHVADATRTGSGFQFDARIVRPDGDVRWVASSGQAEIAPNGQVVGLFGVILDVTDEVSARAALIKAREVAEDALAAKAVFTATMSHEIRTPLTSILTAASLLRNTEDPANRDGYLDTLEGAGRLLSAIVDDVLIFAKLEERKLALEAIAFDPVVLIDEVVAVLGGEAARKGIALEIDGPPAGHTLLGDPARVQRILTNLLSNALKFTETGSITIRVTPPRIGQLWQFEIIDTGIGIDPDRLDAVFDPFVQADASTTRSFGGTGLGLSICRMLIEAMGGTIDVESELGQGTRFWFALPLPVASEAQDASVAPASIAAPSPAQRVLLAEDNEVNRFLIAELVRHLGHDIVTVANGAEAVSAVRSADVAFDVVLMDLQMPVLDGIAATRAIRALDGAAGRVPIYAITANLSEDRQEALRSAGIDGVLAKPIDLPKLSSVLRDSGGATLTVVRPAPATVAEQLPAIDTGRLAGFDKALGRKSRDMLLSLLVTDAGHSPHRMRSLLATGQHGLIALEAHSLRGAAASVGAHALVGSLLALEQAARRERVSVAMLDRIEQDANAVIAAARAAMMEAA